MCCSVCECVCICMCVKLWVSICRLELLSNLYRSCKTLKLYWNSYYAYNMFIKNISIRRTGDMVLVWSIRMREKSYKNNVEYLLFETLGILNRVPKCCWFIGLYRIYLLNLFICVIVRLLHNVCIVFMC